MFGLLLQAVVVKNEKKARNVGMQNFKYAPDLVEFAHIIHTHSAKAYEALKEFLPLPNPRTLKCVRNKVSSTTIILTILLCTGYIDPAKLVFQ